MLRGSQVPGRHELDLESTQVKQLLTYCSRNNEDKIRKLNERTHDIHTSIHPPRLSKVYTFSKHECIVTSSPSSYQWINHKAFSGLKQGLESVSSYKGIHSRGLDFSACKPLEHVLVAFSGSNQPHWCTVVLNSMNF